MYIFRPISRLPDSGSLNPISAKTSLVKKFTIRPRHHMNNMTRIQINVYVNSRNIRTYIEYTLQPLLRLGEVLQACIRGFEELLYGLLGGPLCLLTVGLCARNEYGTISLLSFISTYCTSGSFICLIPVECEVLEQMRRNVLHF